MKKSRFSGRQIITILESVEAGRTARDVCRERGISSGAFHAWKSEFGGMEASDIERMRDLEHENARLKQMYADPNLENRALKDVIEKSSEVGRE
ncbi:transposase [uncultured Desulfovibrio sp.]|uniref:transposase n=1 Tax=uncultured Desulfovibrio sp. TaxID=167968 RepID=UPI00260E06E4|nr:transposase [uncultured Desulfovibrio sp.]